MSRLVRSVTCVGLVVLVSACGPSWPEVRGASSVPLAEGAIDVERIDVLPVDVQIWTHKREKRAPSEIARMFDSYAISSLHGVLNGRGYAVNAAIDWEGRFGGGQWVSALSPQAIAETNYALSSYDDAVKSSGGRLLQAHLPHRLGRATGGDATLYIGGWGYAGKDGSSTGVKVLKGVAIVALVAVVVVVAIASAKGKGGGGKILNGIGRGAAKVAHTGVRVAGKVVGNVGRGLVQVSKGFGKAMMRSDFHININSDCFGRRSTHMDVVQRRPDYYERKTTPRRGRSKTMLSMTLVDNRTGATLWHASQMFPVNPKSRTQVNRAVQQMLATLPARR